MWRPSWRPWVKRHLDLAEAAGRRPRHDRKRWSVGRGRAGAARETMGDRRAGGAKPAASLEPGEPQIARFGFITVESARPGRSPDLLILGRREKRRLGARVQKRRPGHPWGNEIEGTVAESTRPDPWVNRQMRAGGLLLPDTRIGALRGA